jgi:hypothetical protein
LFAEARGSAKLKDFWNQDPSRKAKRLAQAGAAVRLGTRTPARAKRNTRKELIADEWAVKTAKGKRSFLLYGGNGGLFGESGREIFFAFESPPTERADG